MNLNGHLNNWNPRHHSYGISSISLSEKNINDLFSNTQANVYVYERGVYKIDDVRQLASLERELTEKNTVFVIICVSMTREAQNALLKILEEPSSHTYFYLITPRIEKLLPTLQSRLEQLSYDGESVEYHLDMQEFISLPLPERFEYIKKVTDTKKSPDVSKKDVLLLLHDLEVYAQEHKKYELAEVITKAENMLSFASASPKVILDMVAVYIT